MTSMKCNFKSAISILLILSVLVLSGCDIDNRNGKYVSDGGVVKVQPDQQEYKDTTVTSSQVVIDAPGAEGKSGNSQAQINNTSQINKPINEESSSSWINPLDTRLYNMTDNEKSAYRVMAEAFANNVSPIKLPYKLTSEQVSDLYTLLRSTMYEYSNIPLRYTSKNDSRTGNVISISVQYNNSLDMINSMKTDVRMKANSVLLGIVPGSDQMDKIKYIHDYIITHCEYDNNAVYPDSVYGALIDGKAVCEGYSKAFAYLCNQCGIECMLVTGKASKDNSNHMWNIVKCDGKWYHVDVTWDDMGQKNQQSEITYAYLNITTDMVLKDHSCISVNPYFCYPDATSFSDNYYNYKGLYISSYNDASSVISKQLTKALSDGSTYIEFRASDKDLLDQIKDYICNSGSGFGAVIKNSEKASGKHKQSYSFYEMADVDVFGIKIEY